MATVAIAIICIVTIVYRGWIIARYCANTFDDDQALMMDGMAAFARFFFPEPCFWGQSYGSMFESALATPLVWLGVPVFIAGPITTTLISWLPFAFVSFRFYKGEHRVAACYALVAYLIFGWRWDILTAVPRSLISGVPFAVYGAVAIGDLDSKPHIVLGAFFACVGVVMTSSAAIISVMGILAFVWKARRAPRLYMLAGLGGGLAAAYWILRKLFYWLNPDYSLHPAPGIELSVDALGQNCSRLVEICSDFVWAENGIIVLAFLAALYIWFAIRGKRLGIVLLAVNVLLAIGFLSLSKTLDYVSGFVLFSQARMLLCWPYSVLVVVYYALSESKCTTRSAPLRNAVIVLAVILVVVSVPYKHLLVKEQVANPNSELHSAAVISEYQVDAVLATCGQLADIARSSGADVVVTPAGAWGFSYAFEALYRDEFIVYCMEYDRRTWTYHLLSESSPHRCVFVSRLTGDLGVEIVDVDDMSVVGYVAKVYGFTRVSQ